MPQGRLLPTPNRPPPGLGVPPPGAVQSREPLPPPPGAATAPHRPARACRGRPRQIVANAPPSVNPLPGMPPGQKQPAAHRRRPRRCSQVTRSSPNRQPRRSPTSRRCSPASTRSPAASSSSMSTLTRPCSSARCACAARLLHAPADRERQHRCLRRGRGDHAAGRGEGIFSGWMFAASPACTASSIRSTTSG